MADEKPVSKIKPQLIALTAIIIFVIAGTTGVSMYRLGQSSEKILPTPTPSPAASPTGEPTVMPTTTPYPTWTPTPSPTLTPTATPSPTVTPTPTTSPKADLYINGYTFNHAPKQGEAFTISISIYNQGNAAASGFWWEWWPTVASYACRQRIDSMAAHGGRVVTCTYTYGGWANYVTKAVVDTGNEVVESDETNNTYTQNVIPIH